jgi:hypothetical protein
MGKQRYGSLAAGILIARVRMEPTTRVELVTCRLRILSNDALSRAFSALGWYPVP